MHRLAEVTNWLAQRATARLALQDRTPFRTSRPLTVALVLMALLAPLAVLANTSSVLSPDAASAMPAPGDSGVSHPRPAESAFPETWAAIARNADQPAKCRPLPLPPPTSDVVHVSDADALVRAVRELESGTTILIAPGTYDLPNTLHVRGDLRDVAIRGLPGGRDDVVLRGRGMRRADHGSVPHGVLISGAKGVLIADLTIRDVYYHAVQIQGETGAQGVTLYSVRLVDAGEQLVKGSSGGPPGPYADNGTVACSVIEYTDRSRDDYTNGVDVLAGSGWAIRDNVFRRIRAPAGQLAGPAVLMWRNSLDTVVERNTFIDCDRAIALGLSSPDPRTARDGEAVYDHQGGVIRNNFVYRAASSATGDVGITVNHARDVQILNNTVIQSGTFPYGAIEYRFASTTAEIRYNLTDGPIWRRDGANGSVDGNLTSAPLEWFADVSAGDLHLRASASGAIDQGASHPQVTDDFDGADRPHGAAPDLGADEHGATPGGSATATGTVAATSAATETIAATSTATETAVATRTATSEPGPTPTPSFASRVFLPLARCGSR